MIVVAGGAEHLGGRVASILAARGVPVRLLVRDPVCAPQIPGAEVASDDDADAMRGAETVLVASDDGSPGERSERQREAFAAAARAGAGHVVLLSIQGAAPDSSSPDARDAWRSERLLRESGLAHTVLRMGLCAESVLDLIGEDGVVRGPASDGRVAWIARDDAARMVAAVLQSPPGGTLDVTGPEALTLDETMAILTSVVGRRLSYAEETREIARARALMKGEPEWRAERAAGALKAIADGDHATMSDAFDRFVGGPATPFWRWAVGNPALDRLHPTLELEEATVRSTIEDLGWIDDLDDEAVQGHLGFLARQFEGMEAGPELVEAFLRVFERFPESSPELEGNQTALFMLATMPEAPPLLLRSLSGCASAVGTALLVQLLASEEVWSGDVDLREVLVRISEDRSAPPRAHREAVEWLEDPDIERWLRVPGEPMPDL